MTDPRFVMAAVRATDGTVETEALFVIDDGRTLVLELPDGQVIEIDDLEFAEARRAA